MCIRDSNWADHTWLRYFFVGISGSDRPGRTDYISGMALFLRWSEPADCLFLSRKRREKVGARADMGNPPYGGVPGAAYRAGAVGICAFHVCRSLLHLSLIHIYFTLPFFDIWHRITVTKVTDGQRRFNRFYVRCTNKMVKYIFRQRAHRLHFTVDNKI